MGAYPLPEIIRLWEQDRLTPEQAIGQILQHLQSLAERLAALERTRSRAVSMEQNGKLGVYGSDPRR